MARSACFSTPRAAIADDRVTARRRAPLNRIASISYYRDDETPDAIALAETGNESV